MSQDWPSVLKFKELRCDTRFLSPCLSGLTAFYVLTRGDAELVGEAIGEIGHRRIGLKDGKYLVNGHIVVVKNGESYSANGQKLK